MTLTAQLADQYGNPVATSGIRVTWSRTGTGGSVRRDDEQHQRQRHRDDDVHGPAAPRQGLHVHGAQHDAVHEDRDQRHGHDRRRPADADRR